MRLCAFPAVIPVGGEEDPLRHSLPWTLGAVIGLTCVLFLLLSDSGPANPGCALSISSLAGCFPVPLGGGSEGMLWVGWVFFQVGKCECGSGDEKSGDFRLLHGKASHSASSTKWGLCSLPQT